MNGHRAHVPLKMDVLLKTSTEFLKEYVYTMDESPNVSEIEVFELITIPDLTELREVKVSDLDFPIDDRPHKLK